MKLRFRFLLLAVCFLLAVHGEEQGGAVVADADEAAPVVPQDIVVDVADTKESTLKPKSPEAGDYDRAAPDTVHMVKDAKEIADSTLGFWHAFVASLSVIIVSELGDKTWFIAAILAMRHPRLTVFMGAICALGMMTALSAGLGWATQIIPKKVTFYVSTALFALFGLKMLKEGYDMSPDSGQEEYEEAQEEVKKKEEELSKSESSKDLESGGVSTRNPNSCSAILSFVSKIFLESFTLTFLAEWGDRSQITTIILAAREDVVGVTVGGTLGHAICTGIAVLGGRLVAQRISVKTVTLIGGVVFILFAMSAFFINPDAVE